MAMLAGDGFQAISIAQYARFVDGDVAALPDRPILITFDDGLLSSYQGADAILARYDMRATMFVITASADAAKPGYLSWPQLRAMAAGGRWDVQEHAHAGHVRIPTGPGRRTGPYYANLIYRNGTRERFSAFKRRVSSDILAGRRLLASADPRLRAAGLRGALQRLWPGTHQLRSDSGLGERLAAAHLQGLLRPGPAGLQPAGQRDRTAVRRAHLHHRRGAPRLAAAGPTASAWVRNRPKRPQVRRLRVRRRSVVIVFKVRDGIALKATRRRAGRRHRVRVKVSATGRLRNRRLRPGTVYVYRVRAVDAAGHRSSVLRLRVRTRGRR